MDYKKIYQQIIDKSRQQNRKRGDGSYYELHHIIPKCVGGKGKRQEFDHPNLVLLTAKEHFICHKLLVEIYRNTKYFKNIVYSLWSMSILRKKGRDYKISSKEYERLRIEVAGVKSKPILQYDKDGFFMREWASALIASLELEIDMAGIGLCCCKKIKTSKRFIWRFKTKNYPLKINKPKRKPSKQYNSTPRLNRRIPILQFDIEENFIKEWESQDEAMKFKENGFVPGCLNGKQKTSGGYIWKYK